MPQLVLSARTVLAYAAPALGCGYMYLLAALYIYNYSTDVLLIPPAVVGVIYGVSRIVNAFSDPLIGHISDRTRSRFGRRRFWMLVSMAPTALLFYMMFVQPSGLTGSGLVAWMAVAVIGYYVTINFCFIPQLSLGAELSNDAHQRNRLFGMRYAAYSFGQVLGLFALQTLVYSGQQGNEVVRNIAGLLAIAAGLGFGALVLFSVVSLEEKPEYSGSVQSSFFTSFGHVWANHHARLLLIVTFIENVGFAAIAVLTLYVTDYVMHAPLWSGVIILAYLAPSAVFAPLWSRVARRMGKVRLWMASMIATGLAFGGLFPVLNYGSGVVQLVSVMALLFIAGLAAGCGGTIGPSVQSDVIDYDELQNGERKEGTYFAAWDFVSKSAYGIMSLLTGLILQATGFAPNAEQPETARLAIILLYSLFPLGCYLVGAWLFSKFALDEKTHADILERMGKASPSTH
jgi:Na+/melibiose symporter-like transporter